MDGFILVHRKLLNNFVFQNPYYLKLWMWCLMKASYKQRTIYVGTTQVDLEVGQFVWGRREATIELNGGLSSRERKTESTWENYLKKLEKEEMLSRKTSQKFTIVTVNNYEFYQKKVNNTLTTDSQQSDVILNNEFNNEKEVETLDSIEVDSLPFGEINNDFNKSLTGLENDPHQKVNTNNNINNINKYNNLNTGASRSIKDIYNTPTREELSQLNSYKLYEEVFSKRTNQFIAQTIAEWSNDLGPELVNYAMLMSADNTADGFKYTERIMRGWEKRKVTKLEDAVKLNKQFEEKKERELAQKIAREQVNQRFYGDGLPEKEIPVVPLHNWVKGDDQ